jgi:drug/metabolite transporter (DMT)-like permease
VGPINTKDRYFHYLILHIVVFTWGWTGILGKLISMDVLPMIFLRMFITIFTLLPVILFTGRNLRMQGKHLLQLWGVGVIIALHWLFFYQTIKISNVSIAVICLSTSTLFNALAEPLFYKRKLLMYEVLIGIVVTLALTYIFLHQLSVGKGLLFGLISAFFSAMFTTINGRISKHYDSLVFSFHELCGGCLVLLMGLLFSSYHTQETLLPHGSDVWYLLLLSVLCTAFPFVASAWVLKHIPSFSVLLAINLEPVYTILLAWMIFGEEEKMNPPFYIGTTIILLSVFVNGWIKARKYPKEAASS